MLKQNLKNLFIVFLILIIVFLAFNTKNFLSYYYNNLGNKDFLNTNYLQAASNHNNAFNWNKNDIFLYNLAGDYFKTLDFEKGRDLYLKTNFSSGTQDFFDLNYNLGNTFYRIGEKTKNKEKKINNYKQSLESYKKILDLTNDKKTKENYDFVLKKLQELEIKDNFSSQNTDSPNNQEKQNENDSSSGNQSETSSGKTKTEQNLKGKDQERTNSGQKNQNSQSQTGFSERSEEYKIGETDRIDKLTDEEKKQLENYNLYLNQEQKNNINNFGKQAEKSQQNDIFDSFMQDPFFDNFKGFDDGINQEEKDW